MKATLSLVAILFALGLQAQQTKQVLFIGNSYTNDIPNMIAQIALSKGDTLVYDNNTPGGYTLESHSTNATTLSKINAQNWDYVVLQEQSQRPAFPIAQVEVDVFPYVDSLTRRIAANDSCTTPMYYMTWGRENGDAANCPFYAPLCTYEGMQGELRKNYLEMVNRFGGEVAPVGASWKLTRSNPSIHLYSGDGSHPNVNGSYLAACTFYASMFHKSPVGGWVPAGISAAVADTLQHNASSTVFDSLEVWSIDTAELRLVDISWHFDWSSWSFQFIQTSTGANSYHWNFGDGSISNSANPIHTYAEPNSSFEVSLTIKNGCQLDSLSKTVTTPSIGIEEPDNVLFNCNYNREYKSLNIQIISGASANCYVYSANGKLLKSDKLEKSPNSINLSHFPAGVYLYNLSDGESAVSGKFVIAD